MVQLAVADYRPRLLAYLQPTTPDSGSQLAVSSRISPTLSLATPTPANLIFAHRIRSLARNEGNPDDSPLISGRPPGSRWMDERDRSTTPEEPPPLRDVQHRRTMASLSQLSIEADDTAAPSLAPAESASATVDNTGRVDRSDAESGRSSTDSHLLSRSTGQSFKARPAPPTTWAPEHRVRQSRASLLRAGADPDSLGSSTGSGKGAAHVPTDFTAVPGAFLSLLLERVPES